MKKKIHDFVFVLPEVTQRPVGGYKVVFEYANRLSEMGFSTAIIHTVAFSRSPVVNTKKLLNYIRTKLKNDVRPKWFDLSSSISVDYIISSHQVKLKSYNFVATAWQTAAIVHGLREFQASYLIQDFEVWSGKEEELVKSYRLDLHKIAISRWLQKKVLSYGVSCDYLPNGLDNDKFYLTQSIDDRDGLTILALYHVLPKKGINDVIESFKILKARHPQMNFKMFGAYELDTNLPKWLNYSFLPSQEELRELYNSASIFVTASHEEGWGLPACESMQCGCALVASDIAGHREFATEDNALLFVPGDIDGIVKCIESLMLNRQLRSEIAHKGNISIKKFDWSKSLNNFLSLHQYSLNKESYE